jgi:hypothetical protein
MNLIDADKIRSGPKRQKRFPVFASVLLIAVAGGIAWLALRAPPEPVYNGKPLSRWLAQYDYKALNWPRQPMPADAAIRDIGTNAFPMIRKLLRAWDSALKLKLMGFIYRDLHLHFRFQTQEQSHMRALGALGAFGRDAKPLVPTAAEGLNHMSVGERAFFGFWLESLGSDGEAAIPALISSLNDTNNTLRHLTVETLARVGVNQTNVVLPILVKCLQDSNSFVRLQAANEFTREPWVRFGVIDYAEFMRKGEPLTTTNEAQ